MFNRGLGSRPRSLSAEVAGDVVLRQLRTGLEYLLSFGKLYEFAQVHEGRGAETARGLCMLCVTMMIVTCSLSARSGLDLGRGDGVERRGRLVEDQHLGVGARARAMQRRCSGRPRARRPTGATSLLIPQYRGLERRLDLLFYQPLISPCSAGRRPRCRRWIWGGVRLLEDLRSASASPAGPSGETMSTPLDWSSIRPSTGVG